MATIHAQIPTLDLKDFLGSTPQKELFIQDLKNALATKGFFFLKNSGISEKTISTARKAFETFFQFPDEKHFFQIGADRNVDVTEIRNFKPITNELFSEFRTEARVLLSAISLSLGMKEFYLSAKEGNSIMRAIDYPPTENPLHDDGIASRGGNITGMCASKHTDINMITLLEAKEEGLQLLDGSTWLPITIKEPGLIIVNAGDMLEHLTGGRYKSGLHRVVCKRNVRRFSIPFFCHINENESIRPLQHLGSSDLGKYKFSTAGEYLRHRLNAIGL